MKIKEGLQLLLTDYEFHLLGVSGIFHHQIQIDGIQFKQGSDLRRTVNLSVIENKCIVQ